MLEQLRDGKAHPMHAFHIYKLYTAFPDTLDSSGAILVINQAGFVSRQNWNEITSRFYLAASGWFAAMELERLTRLYSLDLFPLNWNRFDGFYLNNGLAWLLPLFQEYQRGALSKELYLERAKMRASWTDPTQAEVKNWESRVLSFQQAKINQETK